MRYTNKMEDKEGKIIFTDVKDEKLTPQQQLTMLESQMNSSQKSDTLGNFGDFLSEKSYSTGFGDGGIPTEAEKNRKITKRFFNSKGAWKYLLALICFAIVFFYFLKLFVYSGLNSNLRHLQ